MRTFAKDLFLLPALTAGLGLILPDRVTAQTFTTLHSFTATSNSPPHGNSDGATPHAGLILSGNTLYGAARAGGSSGNGTVFALNTDGTGFTNLHSFRSVSDGAAPNSGLILSGNTLYGTAGGGGDSGYGTVFAVNTNGAGFTNLHSFPGSIGGYFPEGGLILSGNTLYGTAKEGGGSFNGTVFKVNTDGTGFTNLHSFSAAGDGAFPYAGLILSGNTLYGTASAGGSSGNGTVFALNTDGTGFTNLHSFSGFPSDGATPYAGLVLSGNTLYGVASAGGSHGSGTVFAVNTNGTDFTNLYSFAGYISDGAVPRAGLILSGNILYGTASASGNWYAGTVFKLNTDGTGYANLDHFTLLSSSNPGTNSGGANPYAGLILSGNTLYGTAAGGGGSGYGTVFSLFIPPQLTIIRSGTNAILTWPTNAIGFTLQSTTNLAPSVVWTNVAPGPVIVNGQYAATNPISGTKGFYRLTQ